MKTAGLLPRPADHIIVYIATSGWDHSAFTARDLLPEALINLYGMFLYWALIKSKGRCVFILGIDIKYGQVCFYIGH